MPRRSIRLRGYDYASPSAYFVTICAHERGLIFDSAAIRSVLTGLWHQIPAHFPNVTVDSFVVMPNHVHGIVLINEFPVGAQHAAPSEAPAPVGAQHAAPLQRSNVVPGSLGAIVRSFKAAATRSLRAEGMWDSRPLWQRNYYERVIRDEAELARVREYIQNNPLQWQLDRENPDRTLDAPYDREWGWLETGGDAPKG